MPEQAAPPIEVPQTPGGVHEVNMPGTTVPIPGGRGVQSLIKSKPPFHTNAPAWFTPEGTIWSMLGCAVPQSGRSLHTNNKIIFDFVNISGYSLFDVMWRYQDRKFLRFPTRVCLYDIHQLLVISRDRLFAKTTPDNGTPLVPSKAQPSPKMFLVYPVPFYGPFGCVNQWLQTLCETIMLMQTEAMQHADNEYTFHISRRFLDVVYPYLKYLIVDLATKFFGETVANANVDSYKVSDAQWQAYDPAKFSVPVEATSIRPPTGLTPTDQDLETIRARPYQQVVPFLQPWPDSELKTSTGGIWEDSSSPAGDLGGAGVTNPAGPSNVWQQPGPP